MTDLPPSADAGCEAALRELGRDVGWQPDDGPPVSFTATDPALPSVFAVTTAAAAAVGAASSAAARLWQARSGSVDRPAASVSARHATISFRSERYLHINGKPATGLWEPLSKSYRTRDGWFLLHANMPPHREAALRVLGAEPSPESVEAAIATWSGEDLEDALAASGGCGAAMRHEEQWHRHPQCDAVATLPLVEIERIGDGPIDPPSAPARPAEGLRVLDLSRVIAGPVSTRTLAAHGATVLRIGAPHLWDSETLVVDTGFGKHSADLDLRSADARATVRQLAASADVVVEAYRPGSLGARGIAPAELAAFRPGLVYVSISAYGRQGPWANRRGFDSLVQMASGIAAAGATARGVDHPFPLPAQALDHATGYLAAFGAMVALARRCREGGSWLVRLSLARTGAWLTSLGRVDALDRPDPTFDDVRDLVEESPSAFGTLSYIRPPGEIETMNPRWDRPPVPLGTHPPEWP